ncbi:MAG TPA: amidase family protein, partial [Nannocystaceae bacterium]|nr:amidase family protein [Nannocystaceae bacterium]
MTTLRPSRRGFLLVAPSLAACRPAPTRAPTPTQAPAPTPAPTSDDGFDLATIVAAERVAGVQYEAAERELVRQSLAHHVERAQTRRAFAIELELAPASVFEPRMPGIRMGPTRARMKPARFADAPPSDDAAIAYAPIGKLASWLRRRAITSEKLTAIYLERIARLGPQLACIARTTETLALAQARAADRLFAKGVVKSPLQGIPWGAKDVLDTAGIATTWGAEPFRDRVPSRDATVVARLHAAGAVLVAKLTTGALAYGDIFDGGITKSPWNPIEGASGSSAGPASATAAGLVAFALGTETLGSIVSPAMRCGTAGLRPTFGRVPRTGCMPLCWSLDKIGPLARTVEDTMLVLAAIHGADDQDVAARTMPLAYDAHADVRGLKVGFVPAWLDDADPLDRKALDVLRERGATMVELALPKLPFDALLTTLFAEAAAAFEPITLDGRDDALRWQGPDAWPNTFRTARFIGAIDLVNAERVRRLAMIAMAKWLEQCDAIVGPSFADPMLLWTNATGHPCLVVRTGFIERAPNAG